MERVKSFSKVSAIVSLLLIAVAIMFDCGGRGSRWPLLTLVAPVTLSLLFVIYFSLLNKAGKPYHSLSILGIAAFFARLLSQLLVCATYCVYNYLHKDTLGISMASGFLNYVHYILLLVTFLLLQVRFKQNPFLRAVTILFPLALVGLFVSSLVNLASVQTPVYEYLRAIVPYLMSAAFFYVYSNFNTNTILS